MNNANSNSFIAHKVLSVIVASITSIVATIACTKLVLSGSIDILTSFSYGAGQIVAGSFVLFFISNLYRRNVVVPLMQIAEVSDKDISPASKIWVSSSAQMLYSARYIPFTLFASLILLSGVISPRLIIDALEVSSDADKAVVAAFSIATLVIIALKSFRKINTRIAYD